MRNSIFSDFISLFFPRYCYACRTQLYRAEEYICLNCQHTLPKTNYHLKEINPVMMKMYGKAPISFASAYLKFVKSGKTQRLIHMLKYRNKPEIGKLLGEQYGRELSDHLTRYGLDLIIPVPLHKKKLKKRGYNQSEAFAEGLSCALGIPVMNLLIREKQSTTQTKKSKIERWENVAGTFQVTDKNEVKGKNILLVDDVITTGSTLAECANELLAQGAGDINIATLAVAEYL